MAQQKFVAGSQGSALTINPPGSATLTVNITGGVVTSDAAGTTTVTFPATVNSSTTYYSQDASVLTVSAKISGSEAANGAGGTYGWAARGGSEVSISPALTTTQLQTAGSGPSGAPNLSKYQVASPGLYETCPRWALTSATVSIGGTGGTANPSLYAVALPSGLVVTKIGFLAGTVSSPTHYFFQLYDSSYNLLAETADQGSAAWTSNTVKSLSIAQVATGAASSFTTTYEGLHYVALVMQASSANANETSGVGVLGDNPPLTPWMSNTISTTAITAFPYQGTKGGVNAGMIYGFVG